MEAESSLTVKQVGKIKDRDGKEITQEFTYKIYASTADEDYEKLSKIESYINKGVTKISKDNKPMTPTSVVIGGEENENEHT